MTSKGRGRALTRKVVTVQVPRHLRRESMIFLLLLGEGGPEGAFAPEGRIRVVSSYQMCRNGCVGTPLGWDWCPEIWLTALWLSVVSDVGEGLYNPVPIDGTRGDS